MELKELMNKTLEIFEVKSEDALADKIFNAVKNNVTTKFCEFRDLVGGNVQIQPSREYR